MKIMISGGIDEQAANTNDGRVLEEFARKLSESVLQQGHELLCGNVSSLDELLIDSACKFAEQNEIDPEQYVCSYHPRGSEPRTIKGNVNGSANKHWNLMDGRKLAVPEPIANADVLILLGGYGEDTGTYAAANWARHTGTPILPLYTFGMASSNIFDDLPSNYAEKANITGLTDEDLQRVKKSISALSEEGAITKYACTVVSLAEKAALSREVFLIMSFEGTDDLADYRAAISSVCEDAGFEAVRTDTRPAANTHQIVDDIHHHIQSCGFVIADLTNERPNVYYEIGYAMALEKKLILTSKKGTPVHFDLQGFSRVEWTGSENLKEQLKPIVDEYAQLFGLS